MPSRNRIQICRRRAFEQQGGRCYYCGVRMWLTSPNELSTVLRRRPAWDRLRCTAEHLVAQCEGGGHMAQNIVAACARCNHTRHTFARPPDPPAYRKHVARQVEHRAWHQRWVYEPRSDGGVNLRRATGGPAQSRRPRSRPHGTGSRVRAERTCIACRPPFVSVSGPKVYMKSGVIRYWRTCPPPNFVGFPASPLFEKAQPRQIGLPPIALCHINAIHGSLRPTCHALVQNHCHDHSPEPRRSGCVRGRTCGRAPLARQHVRGGDARVRGAAPDFGAAGRLSRPAEIKGQIGIGPEPTKQPSSRWADNRGEAVAWQKSSALRGRSPHLANSYRPAIDGLS